MSLDLSPWLNRVTHADVLTYLKALPDDSVDCVVTSPPYWGLRSYGTEPLVWGGLTGCEHEWGDVLTKHLRGKAGEHATVGNTVKMVAPRIAQQGQFCLLCGAWYGELGSEPRPSLFISNLMGIMGHIRRVLKPTGTCWVNLGDTYGSGAATTRQHNKIGHGTPSPDERSVRLGEGVKNKDLALVPFRFAIAAQESGWYVRSIITWAKAAGMPEPVHDRPVSAWEPIFLLTKSPRYWYDIDAVREPHAAKSLTVHTTPRKGAGTESRGEKFNAWLENGAGRVLNPSGANQRNWWHLGPEPYPEAHFAVFPTEIPRRAIKAGCPPGGVVLDPFCGRGTTAAVALELGRDFLTCEWNRDYVPLAEKFINQHTGWTKRVALPLEVAS